MLQTTHIAMMKLCDMVSKVSKMNRKRNIAALFATHSNPCTTLTNKCNTRLFHYTHDIIQRDDIAAHLYLLRVSPPLLSSFS